MPLWYKQINIKLKLALSRFIYECMYDSTWFISDCVYDSIIDATPSSPILKPFHNFIFTFLFESYIQRSPTSLYNLLALQFLLLSINWRLYYMFHFIIMVCVNNIHSLRNRDQANQASPFQNALFLLIPLFNSALVSVVGTTILTWPIDDWREFFIF